MFRKAQADHNTRAETYCSNKHGPPSEELEVVDGGGLQAWLGEAVDKGVADVRSRGVEGGKYWQVAMEVCAKVGVMVNNGGTL